MVLTGPSQGVTKADIIDMFDQGVANTEKGKLDVAYQFYSRAAHYGYIKAQHATAKCLIHGRGVAKDVIKGNMWLFQAAKGEYPQKVIDLYNCYYNGIGTEQDRNKAYHIVHRAAASGNTQCMIFSGMWYILGRGVFRSVGKGKRILMSALGPTSNITQKETRRVHAILGIAGAADDGASVHICMNKLVKDVLTLEDLNRQITPLHNKLTASEFPEYPVEWCGIENESWHQECVPMALNAKYGEGKYIWEQVTECDNVQTLVESRTGRYYVHGRLNCALYETTEETDDWTHTICVDADTNRFFDFNTCGWRLVHKWFNTPAPYLLDVYYIYKLELL